MIQSKLSVRGKRQQDAGSWDAAEKTQYFFLFVPKLKENLNDLF